MNKCSFCRREMDPEEFVTEINPAGGYGRERMLSCDPCIVNSEDGSKLAEIRDRFPERYLPAAVAEIKRLRSDEPRRLWLWKNFVDGRPEYWAFDNPYPCQGYPGGDPITLGSPCGYVLVKTSFNGRPEVTEEQVMAEIKSARPA